MINVGIIGVTGYAGEELLDILLRHPQVRIRSVSAKVDKPVKIQEIFPKFTGRTDLFCNTPDLKEIISLCDVVFLALPHTVSMGIVPRLLQAGKRVIDLSADFRLKDLKVYEKFYQVKHTDKDDVKDAVYGLPELYRQDIKTAKLIANPGCYPTVSILALAPLVALGFIQTETIVIDAKSGVTGAGRKIAEGFLFSEVNEDFKAYKVNVHQHAPEINQELSKLAGKKLKVTFVPHLLPLNRGILATIYAQKNQKVVNSQGQKLINLYKKFYKKEPFVRVREERDYPRLKDVIHTNFCDIAIKEEKERVIIVAAIDNLLKGASGQAVQNMNIMHGFGEQTALV
ncbi:MAG: N-acetyl-gamma-glutamyl-phosphate reductase [Candidatus Omnitrophica bacterium]|nr:N-acetyl-gamma-glutamyl-phosphate reductase [Candidatus Omnitrophota bacterium]